MYRMIHRSKGSIVVVDSAGKEHGTFATPFHAKMHIQKLLKERAPKTTKGLWNNGS